MKGITILLLGVMIWFGSLLWPEVNSLFSPAVTLAMLAGLTALLSLSVVIARLSQRCRSECCDGPRSKNTSDCSTRPVTMTLSSR